MDGYNFMVKHKGKQQTKVKTYSEVTETSLNQTLRARYVGLVTRITTDKQHGKRSSGTVVEQGDIVWAIVTQFFCVRVGLG